MTDETTRPKRRFRRWIIAGVLLIVVMGLAVWLVFPKADGRFLGTWSANGGVTMTFDRLGIVHIVAQKRNWHFRWTVEGNLLVMGDSEPKAPRSAVEKWLVGVAEKWSGSVVLPQGRDEYDIINISPNRIHLRHRNSWEHLPDTDEILTR